jgi:hypothetical protein
MALDTAQKRRSMLSFARMNYAERVPQATNYDSAADRAQMLYLYAGIDPASPTPPPVTSGRAHHQLLKRKRDRVKTGG